MHVDFLHVMAKLNDSPHFTQYCTLAGFPDHTALYKECTSSLPLPLGGDNQTRHLQRDVEAVTMYGAHREEVIWQVIQRSLKGEVPMC